MPRSTAASAHPEEHDAAEHASNHSSEISEEEAVEDQEEEKETELEEEFEEEEEMEVKEEEDNDYDHDDDDEEEDEEAAAGAEQETDPAEELKEKRNDVGQHMVSKRTGEQWVSSSTPEISEPKPHCDSLLKASACNFKTDTSTDSLTIHQEESLVSYGDAEDNKSGKHFVAAGENKTRESGANKKDTEAIINKDPKEFFQAHGDSKDYVQNTEVNVADTFKPSIVMEKELTTASDVRGCSILDSKNEVEPMNLQAEDHRKQIASRLIASKIRTRSPSPSAKFKNGSKRPAVLCDFFAKGWCIKGTSCSFLHQNVKADNASQQDEGDIAAAYLKTEEQLEGFRDNMEKSQLPGYPEPMTFPEAILPLEDGERQRLNQLDEKHKFSFAQGEDLSSGVSSASQQLSPSKWDPGFSPFKDDVGYQRAPNNCGRCSPIMRGIRSQYMHSSNLDASLSSSRTLPSHHMSAWLGSFSFSPSLNSSQKVLDSDIDHLVSRSSSFLQCASFYGSEPPRLPRTSRSLDPLHAEHRKKFLPNDWEPSVPFQPSFFITPTMISSPGGQYDPLRDSIDTPIRGKSFKFSFVSQMASILNTSHQPMSGDSSVSQSLGSEYNGDKRTPSSNNRFFDSNKDSNTPGKGSFMTGKLTGENVIDGHVRVMLEEENASDTSCVRHSSNNNKNDATQNARHQVDGSRCKRDSKVDRVGSQIEMEVDQRIDGDIQKESKAMRLFHAALVDFLKELLKPTWREGLLSKDAHNTIVKKTVDKVLSTLQSHQVPPTMESTNQYLSLSRPKLTKLLEAYITKYGKS